MDTTHSRNTNKPGLTPLFLGRAVIIVADSEELTHVFCITR